MPLMFRGIMQAGPVLNPTTVAGGLEKLGVVDYWFVWRPDEVRYHKYVHYFLMAFVDGDTQIHDDEAEDVVWLPIADAISAERRV